MMRLIDADALRESLFESSQFDTYNDYSMVIDTIDLAPTIEPDWNEMLVLCDNCGHAVHVKRINAKPIIESERKTEWLPCSEKLPKPYEDVLVSTSQNRIQLGWIDRDAEWTITRFRIGDDKVLAWMPLPKSYKEEKTDG